MSFNANGGTVSPSSKVVEKTCPIGWLPTPVRTGYVFQQWNTRQDGRGTAYVSSTKVPGSGYPTTLYAIWSGEVHTVTFDLNGGLVGAPESALHRNYTYGQQFGGFVSQWCNKEGEYVGVYPWWVLARDYLIGWFDDPREGNQYKETDVCHLLRDTTLYAHWKPIVSHITFILRGGTYQDSTDDPVIGYIMTDGVGNLPFGRLPKVKREGCSFLGWRTIPDDRAVYDDRVPHSKWPYQREEWVRLDDYQTYQLHGDYMYVQMIERNRIVTNDFVPPFWANSSEDPDYIPYYYADVDDEGEPYFRWMNGFRA